MTTPHPAVAGNGKRQHHPDPGVGDDAPDAGRVGRLRGASVQIEPRRIVAALTGLVLVTLAILVAALTVAGVHKNEQIDELHRHGVPVTVTVTGCLGLLGGSGSNAAGYSCHGTYSLDGHRYSEPLPGSAFHRPGTTLPAVAVPGDPALVSPRSIVESEHTSASVFVLPAVLFALLVAALLAVVVWRRRDPRAPSTRRAARGD